MKQSPQQMTEVRPRMAHLRPGVAICHHRKVVLSPTEKTVVVQLLHKEAEERVPFRGNISARNHWVLASAGPRRVRRYLHCCYGKTLHRMKRSLHERVVVDHALRLVVGGG